MSKQSTQSMDLQNIETEASTKSSSMTNDEATIITTLNASSIPGDEFIEDLVVRVIVRRNFKVRHRTYMGCLGPITNYSTISTSTNYQSLQYSNYFAEVDLCFSFGLPNPACNSESFDEDQEENCDIQRKGGCSKSSNCISHFESVKTELPDDETCYSRSVLMYKENENVVSLCDKDSIECSKEPNISSNVLPLHKNDSIMSYDDLPKLGDVIKVIRGRVKGCFSQNPDRKDIEVYEWGMVEPWSGSFSGVKKNRQGNSTNTFEKSKNVRIAPMMFHSPTDHINGRYHVRADDKNQLACSEEAEKVVFEDAAITKTKSNKVKEDKKLPIAIIQCLNSHSNRLLDYFNQKNINVAASLKDEKPFGFDNLKETEEKTKKRRCYNSSPALTAAIASQLKKDRLIFIYGDNEVFSKLHLENGLPHFLHSPICRVYWVTEPPLISIQEAMRVLLTTNKSNYLKILTFPSELENNVYDAAQNFFLNNCHDKSANLLINKEVSKQSNKINTLVYADGYYWLGLDVSRVLISDKDVQSMPSSAYYKLFEIDSRFSIPADERCSILSKYRNSNMAIDVGGSPGGWTYCLTKDFGVKHVISIDPAKEMHELVRECIYKSLHKNGIFEKLMSSVNPTQIAEKEGMKTAFEALVNGASNEERSFELSNNFKSLNSKKKIFPMPAAIQKDSHEHYLDIRAGSLKFPIVEHWNMTGQEAIEHLGENKTDIFVCDANIPPKISIDILELFIKKGRIQRPCLVVITFKNTDKNTFTDQKKDGFMRLTKFVNNLQELHLFANKKLETTVVGELL